MPVRRAALLGAALLVGAGCSALEPEVIVVSELGEAVLVRQVSFSGCLWDEVLASGEATSPGRCLAGEDRVHLARLDAAAYCREQVADGTIPELCLCDPEDAPAADPLDSGLVDPVPRWFNYRTLASYEVGPGDLLVVTLTAEGLEQDFEVPGPYGH